VAFYDQPQLSGQIGEWACEGRADLVRVERGPDGGSAVTIVDIKASRRESVGYRLQVAFYALLAREALAAAGVRVDSMAGAVAAREADFAAAAFETFELGLYEDDVRRLVAGERSDVSRVARTPFAHCDYALGPHCDGCSYNATCFVDSAEREDLSLVPLVTASEKAALRAEGVRTARDLAGLLEYGDEAMAPAAGREAVVERIARRRPLGARLPVLAQRARAALRRLDRSVEAKPYLVGSGFGSLPSDDVYPDLVKVFVDAQRDYLQDRLFLISAVVAGPGGAFEVAEMLDAPPDTDSERELLLAWLRRALPAVAAAAGAAAAPLHVYLFDARGQRSLLDALARHFDAVCAISATMPLSSSTR
jgi:hypothetical protein